MDEFLEIENIEIAGAVFGSFDENVKLIEKECSVDITTRDSGMKISGSGESVEKAKRVLRALLDMARRGDNISAQNVSYVISMVEEGNEQLLAELGADNICITAKGRPIKPKTIGQKEYVKAISSNTITLGVGPAGTGKTYLAVAMAVTALRNKQISRIILTRPAVEAGEKLGFLPGDLQNKVDPYLRPLNDALFDMSLAEMSTMVSLGSRSFSYKVLPVSTISTITSLRPKIGAISIEPLRCIMSMSRHFSL